MKKEVEIIDYKKEGAVGYFVNEKAKIECGVEGREIFINANEEGLELLAGALLTLG